MADTSSLELPPPPQKGASASPFPASPADPLAFLAGGGEMGERCRAKDWSGTLVGPPANWPQSLKTAVSICLGSRYSIFVWWGADYTMFYNDAYIPVLGVTKHPGWLGRSARECWSEIWSIVGPMIDGVFAGGEATWSEDLLLVMNRNIPLEENYFTFSYSPIRDDTDAIGGIFCACHETTGRVIGERRLRTLRDLSRGVRAQTAEEACAAAVRTLGENPADIPFALIYLLDPDGGQARLVAAAALEAGSPAAPNQIEMHADPAKPQAWPLHQMPDTATTLMATGLSAKFGQLPGGLWPESAENALVVPLTAPGQTKPIGFLVAGLSPRRVIDADYRSFVDLVAGHIGTSMANARAYEQERKRAEALAEIDRVKTAFFSNVSHEFRTPLTLMMGPLEDTLARPDGLASADRVRLEMVHRNSVRLLKLVNTLLDFSRIEAGRVQASYEATNLPALTAELASVFRSAIERAGLKLIIDCPPMPEPVHVDREMWEKIVLNLLSNAFKFTFTGEIEVTLRKAAGTAELTVRDTGTGIPKEEIPRLFERFHRVKGARGRSYEGSGIGLALVQELAKLHGGGVRVESRTGGGSRFIVSIPLGKAHLPGDRIGTGHILAELGVHAEAYAQEALRWLPDAAGGSETGEPGIELVRAETLEPGPRPAIRATGRILLADDNNDMREYVRGLLTACGYEVEAVADGLAALEAARARKPDLVLTDIMMPGLDGFGLLREMRADGRLSAVPVIALSARAGEEARIEGLQSGADDYLIKPFSARELTARVEAHLKMSRLRHEATEALRYQTAQFETLINQAPLGVYLLDADFRLRQVNPIARPRFADIPGGIIGRNYEEIMRIMWNNEFATELVAIHRHTLETGEPFVTPERPSLRRDRGVTEYFQWRLDRIVLPDGRFGVVCYFQDISAQVAARQELKQARDEAVAANRAKDDFLAALSHELRTPLNPVLLVSSESAHDAALPEAVREDFAMIADSVSLQARLIDDLLDLSRISHGKITLARQSADLHQIIRDAATTIQEEIARKDLQVSFALEAPSSTVHGDPVRLRQVFWNVIRNSVKFTPARRGTIQIQSENTPGQPQIVVRVCDSGSGLPASDLKSIFEPFTQGRPAGGSGHIAQDGLGLGLAISRMLVDSHGGTIAAESAGADRGTTIVVHLPVIAAAPSSGSGSRPPLPATKKSPAARRVLFVDDHGPTRTALAAVLQRRGFDVVPAQSMTEAVHQAGSRGFDLLISDVGLPDGDGWRLMTKLREEHPALPGIAISGYGMEADLAKSRAAGFAEHLTKPVSIDALEAALARIFKP